MSELNIDLRRASAIIVKEDGKPYSHQTMSNRYSREDGKQLTYRDVYEIVRKEEQESLTRNALRYKRLDFVREYFNTHGVLPSDKEIDKITLESEVSYEKFETV